MVESDVRVYGRRLRHLYVGVPSIETKNEISAPFQLPPLLFSPSASPSASRQATSGPLNDYSTES